MILNVLSHCVQILTQLRAENSVETESFQTFDK